MRRLNLRNALPWLLPLAFAAIVILLYPFRFVFEFNPDEGLHLMRSLLHLRGFELYGEIYNDQPPLFTLMLSGLFSIFGFHATIGRLFVLLLSTALIFSALAYLRTYWGLPHAIAGWIVLLLLPKYAELSVSVMISLPSIAFAMISFFSLTRWHRKQSIGWLFLSAIALGLSVLTKIFTGLLVLPFAAGLLAAGIKEHPAGSLWRRLRPAILWSLVFLLLISAAGLIAIGPENLPQLIRGHLSARQSERYQLQADSHSINYALGDARGILLLSFLGALIALWRREWTALYPISWAILAYGGLSVILPVWAHHQLLVTVPASILAAILLGEITTGLANWLRSPVGLNRALILRALGFLLAVVILGARVPPVVSELSLRLPNFRYTLRPIDVRQYEILALMWKHADETEWVVTDRPMYAFRIEKPVPPELAVISEKRLWSGSISEDQMIQIIDHQRPEQVLLVRFPLRDVQAHLRGAYEPIYYLGEWRLFLRSDLADRGSR